MSSLLKFGTAKKQKVELIRKEKTLNCQTICVCSFSSTVHVMVPLLKVLNRLGTVQVLSEDRSLMMLSKDLDTEFTLGDIQLRIVESIVLLDDEELESLNDFDYNVVVVNDFLPELKIDKYINLDRRHHFRAQIDTPQKRYTPMFSVLNRAGLTKEEYAEEESIKFVNEVLTPLPPFAVCSDYLSALFMGRGTADYRINAKVSDFIIECLNGIEGCDKRHIRQILLEKSELFASPS